MSLFSQSTDAIRLTVPTVIYSESPEHRQSARLRMQSKRIFHFPKLAITLKRLKIFISDSSYCRNSVC